MFLSFYFKFHANKFRSEKSTLVSKSGHFRFLEKPILDSSFPDPSSLSVEDYLICLCCRFFMIRDRD